MKQRPMHKYSQFTGSYVRLAYIKKKKNCLWNKALKLVLTFSVGSVLKCSSCSSSVSYEDCRKTLTVDNCTNPNQTCYQAEVISWKEDFIKNFSAKGMSSKRFLWCI